MSLVLFPYMLGHVCNIPFGQADVGDRTRPLLKSLHTLIATEHQRQSVKVSLVDDLLPHIEQVTDRRVHQRLYSIRRDIYNDRPLRSAEQAFALETLPPPLAGRVADWADALERQRTLTAGFEAEYNQLSYVLRQQLQQRVDHEPFKEALVFASHSLLESIRRYREKEVSAFHSKEFGLEMTLLKYYTRMATKASPFSQFTSVFCSDLRSSGRAPDPGRAPVRSVVQPNRALLGQLKLILSLDERTCPYFTVYLNPTLALHDQGIHFLRSRGNKDSQHYLPVSPETRHLYTILKKGPQPYRIVQQLLTDGLNAEESMVNSLLARYIDLGLLETEFGVDPDDPDWIDALRRELLRDLPADNPLGMAIQTALTALSAMQPILRNGSAPVRQTALEQATVTVNTLRAEIADRVTGKAAQALSSHAGFLTIQPHQLFFEDTYRSDLPIPLNSEALKPIAGSLQQLLSSQAYFDENALPRHRLYEGYVRHFGAAALRVLTVYEHYRTHNAWTDETSTPGQPNAAQRTRQVYRQWLEQLRQRAVAGHGSLTLQADDLCCAARISGLAPTADLGSASAFVQLMTDSVTGGLRAVLNSIHTGYGKMSSRFLHQLPVSMTTQLIRQNADATTDVLRCELDDATHSNANVHPLLLPYRLTLAGHQQARRPADLLVRDLSFLPDPTHQRLRLIHTPTQQVVELYDLGTVLASLRSPLFAFLSLFTTGNRLNLQPFLKGFYQPYIRTDGVSSLPRLVMDGRVVLQRQAWHVPRTSLPPSFPGQSAAVFFCQLHQWREAAGIPSRVFVFVQSKFLYQPADLQNLSRDDTKPQFINFEDPMLAGLFGKLLNKVKTAMLIEEMLPDAPDLMPFEGQGTVCEYLLQWYTSAAQNLPDHGL
jgi:hypothetical protein